MGEYAEMMLDGTCCAGCGEYLGSDNGYATYCASCSPDYLPDDYQPPGAREKKHKCRSCNKKFRSKAARSQHERDTGHAK